MYANDMVYLDIADDMLVFDGKAFSPVTRTKRVAFGSLPPGTPVQSAPQNVLPVQVKMGNAVLAFSNTWICTVLERSDSPPPGVTPVIVSQNIIVNPPDGELVCLVTCHGTDVQYIQVI